MSDTAYRPVLPQGTLIMLTLAATLVVAVGLRYFSDILGPVALALVLAIAVHPVRRGLKNRGAPTWVATIGAVVAVYLLVVGIVWSILAVGTHFASMMVDYAPQVQHQLEKAAQNATDFGIDQAKLESIAGQIDLGKLVDTGLGLIGGLAGILSSIFFLIVLLFFTVTDAGAFSEQLENLPERGARLADAFGRFAEGTRSYLWVSTVFGLLVAAIDTLALWMLGVQDPLIWGVLAFLTNYIPNIGFIIGLVPPAIIAWIDFGFGRALAVIAVYCVVNFVLQTIIQPRVVGDAVGLSATLSFLSLLFWGSIFGGIGAIIAIPMSLLVKAVFLDSDPDRQWVTPLFGTPTKPKRA